MKGYWIALYKKIENQDNLKKYGEAATPVIKSYGGKALVRGSDHKVLEGNGFERIVIWEFPSFEKANECHDSKEYLEAWSYAKKTTHIDLVIAKEFNN